MNRESPFRSIGTKGRLVDRVVNEIERLIIDGQLEPGMRLPPERDLADEIGVSRTVIREAVRILAARGLLETKQGVGTTVQQITRDQIVEPLNRLVQIRDGGVSFEELHQVRSILEVEIAELAASKSTEADIANLRQIMTDMEANQDNPDAFASKDANFHQALARMTHNPLLDLLSGVIRDLLEDYIALVTRRIDVRQQVLPYHYRILDRVAARDPEGARQAMREHLKQIRRNHEEAFTKQ